MSRLKKSHPLHTYLVFIALLFIGFICWLALLKPIPIAKDGDVVVVKPGQTYYSVLQELAAKKKVMFPRVISIYRRLFVNKSLKAGVYPISAGTNTIELLDILSQGRSAQMTKITIIEGTTFAQLLNQLADNSTITHTVGNLSEYEIMQKVNSHFNRAEGWFAPDTYFFAQNETDIAVLNHLYQQQNNILNKEWETRTVGLPYKSIYDALIMASIVEKETGIASDRARIAGVFINRLQAGMRLQTDPTVIYGMGNRYNGNITRKDLETPTAYNTYTIDGLPPTPICLPSKASIIAALHPDKRGDLYFVASGDKDGHSTFSKTLTEHNQAVAAYLQVTKNTLAPSSAARKN